MKKKKKTKTMTLFLEVTEFSERPKVYGEYSKNSEKMYGKYKAFRVILEE